MRNITVSVDDETYRHARTTAAEAGTSVSALVRDYLRSLVHEQRGKDTMIDENGELESERRRNELSEVLADIRARGGGLRVEDNLTREELYDRAARREEARLYYGNSYGEDALR